MTLQSDMQSAFDTACTALVLQGKRSSSFSLNGGSCFYRHPSIPGVKCGVGHLVSDEQMTRFKIKEGDGSDQFPVALIQELFPSASGLMELTIARNFLDSIQAAHDGSSPRDFVGAFKSNAKGMSEEWGLTLPSIAA